MPALSLVGPSYALRFGKADNERTINYIPVQIESGLGKGGAGSYLKQFPGLSLLAGLGHGVRGFCVARDVMYVVAGVALYEVSSTWAATNRGTVGGSGIVEMSANNTQIAITSGAFGYVYDLDSKSLFSQSTNWLGSNRVDVLDGFGIFSQPGTSQFYISGNQDFSSLDALDFASLEGSAGNLVAWVVKHREILFLKQNTGEVWYDNPDQDFPLARNSGANIEVGCAACYSLRKIGGVAYWLGRDENGAAAVFQMSAYQPQRISNHWLEEHLQALGDVSDAYAFTFHFDGLTFYVLQVPGMSTTPCFEVTSGLWFELAELVDGEYQPWRGVAHAYVYGKHVIGDASGNLYELDPTKNTNNGDTLVRDRITPHFAKPSMRRQRVGSIQFDCDVGQGLPSGQQARLMLRYSDDGGKTWGNWRYLTLGNVGQYKARARATMLGSARDRVWHIRITDDVTCNLLAAVVDEL